MALHLTVERKLRSRMRWWRAGCFATILVFLPFARIGFEVISRQTGVMARHFDCRSTKYGRLWDCPAGDERSRLTEPLNERERRVWDGVLARAREHGFLFRDPVPVRTNREADMLSPPSGHTTYAETFPSGRVMFNSPYMDRFDDDELAIVMGHELGHQIDWQNERAGHPVLNRLANADSETVAWGVSAELYGGDAIQKWRDKWQVKLVDLD